MGTRSEFVGKKKDFDVVGFDLRMQDKNQTCGSKRLMVHPPHIYNNYHNNHESSQLLSSSPSSSGFFDDGGGGGGSGGPLFCNTSNQVASVSDIYDIVGAASGPPGSHAAAVLFSKSMNSDSLFPGEMAARVPFTATQLQEFERQTMIFKYMVSSVPVPHELLLPFTTTRTTPPSNIQEPWRCRRTDGKKWRCSRDVAPDQKYCERHSHKSRPRSRKPVELPAHRVIINNNTDHNNANVTTSINNKPYSRSISLNQTTMASSLPSSYEQHQQQQQPPRRCLDWFMKGETTMPPVVVGSDSNQEWHQMMLQSKLESKNSNLYINLGGDNLASDAQRLHDQYNFLLNSPKQTQETRHFIDAWSMAEGNIGNVGGIGGERFVSADEKLLPSSLRLSMCGGSETMERNENDNENSLMGMLGNERGNVGNLRPHWMNHVSGMSSPPGGPLAEALCLGIASCAKPDSNSAASTHGCTTSTTTSSGDGGQGINFIN